MTAGDGQSFPKAARIRRRREFLSLGRTAEKRRTRCFVFAIGRSMTPLRLGITVSRKVGGAVQRNLLKRRIREEVRRHPERERYHGDLLVIARSGIGAVRADVVRRELEVAFDSLRSRSSSEAK